MNDLVVFVKEEKFYKYGKEVLYGNITGFVLFSICQLIFGTWITIGIYFAMFLGVGLFGVVINRKSWTDERKYGIRIISFAFGLYLVPFVLLFVEVIIAVFFIFPIL